jgi:site-specific DNA-methyltransferase (adenine-specific)
MSTTATVHLQDALEGISQLENNSIDALITDPPYFLHKMGSNWDNAMVNRKASQSQTVRSLQGGMKFDKQQGLDFQKFMNEIATATLDKIKPGGWLVSFAAPRLYHRLAVAIEDAGYEIRDMWQWLYTQNQMKAMSVARTMNMDKELTIAEKGVLEKEFENWKTPQVKSCFEPIVLAQKTRAGTYYNNWKQYHIGLINVKSEIGLHGNMDTANVITTETLVDLLDKAFLVGKPSRAEKGQTTHLSVKPLALMEHLVKVLVPAGGTVLDPFNGSGTTGIAALNTNRNYIGFENNREYWNQSMKRFQKDYRVELAREFFVANFQNPLVK